MNNKISITLLISTLFILNSVAQNVNLDTLLYDLNPKLFKADFSEYDKNTAIYCAQLSELSYWDSEDISHFISKLNKKYPDTKHYSAFMEETKSGTQLIFFGTHQYIIIAFRGTEFFKEVKDIILDVKLLSYYQDSGYSNLPAGHGGFRRSIMNLIDYEDFFNKLLVFRKLCNPDTAVNLPIYTTGHSLGAALATLIIEPLDFEHFNYAGTYNFAPPLVISQTDTLYLSQKYHSKVYDIVNYLDYIPRAGKRSRKYLGRIGKFYRICENGLINNEDEKRNNKYVSHRWRTKFKLYEYHKLAGYINGLKHSGNTNEEIIQRRNNGSQCF